MDWDFDSLWSKARLFSVRALEEEREDPLFAFWSVLAMEALCRSVLASVHPALLADPRKGSNLLYAFGYRTDNPKSIPMVTVLRRLEVVVPAFTTDESKVISALIERRNAELHTGHVAFHDYPTELWLADYYAAANVLLEQVSLSLDDLLGKDEAEAARQMIEARSEEIREEVQKLIDAAKELFAGLSDEQKQDRLDRPRGRTPYLPRTITTEQDCPVCGYPASVVGQQVSLLEPRAEEDVVVRSVVALPISLDCPVCELKLDGHGSLHVAGKGGQFTKDEYFDPADYYGIEFDPADYFEPDYGND